MADNYGTVIFYIVFHADLSKPDPGVFCSGQTRVVSGLEDRFEAEDSWSIQRRAGDLHQM